MKFTRNQSLVLEVLQSSDQPLSAYGILDRLREHGSTPGVAYSCLFGTSAMESRIDAKLRVHFLLETNQGSAIRSAPIG